MREHLFRGFAPNENGTQQIVVNGKKIKGEWVEGNYNYYSIGNLDRGKYEYFNQYEILGQEYPFVDYAVLPETVGEFTGLTDKNGKKIFEWDKIRNIYMCLEDSILKIAFQNGRFIGITQENCEESILKNCEVIGTVFDEVKE